MTPVHVETLADEDGFRERLINVLKNMEISVCHKLATCLLDEEEETKNTQWTMVSNLPYRGTS